MPKTKEKVYQVSPKVLACRENGRLGGLARAKKVSKAKRKKWSSKGGSETFKIHGSDFMSWTTTRRKTVGRYKKPVKPGRKVKPRTYSEKKLKEDSPKLTKRKAITALLHAKQKQS